MRLILSRPLVALCVLGAFLLVLWVAAYLSPPSFIQTGKYFWSGPSLAEISGVWTCVPDPTEECEPIRLSFIEAITADPYPSNWWPIRISLIEV